MQIKETICMECQILFSRKKKKKKKKKKIQNVVCWKFYLACKVQKIDT